MNGKPTVVSVFAGCGGSSLGYKWAGFEERLAIEWDNNAVKTFKLNFNCPIWKRDIREVTGKEILEYIKLKPGELDILDGSPPCQGFSFAGKRKINDSRNNLSYEFIRLIQEIQPKVFVMENVSAIVKGRMKGKFIEIMKTLKKTGYNIKCKSMNAMHYEVPQTRERVIWIGVKDGIPVFPKPYKYIITAREALKGINNKTFSNITNIEKKYWDIAKHGRWVGKYRSNIKIQPNKPCNCIRKSSPHFHWKERRKLTIEEGKRLSSFPDNFILTGSYSDQWARLGNAVMPKFMEHIARTIKTEVLGYA